MAAMSAGRVPRVGISRCLLGDDVRYDGGHKRAAELLDTLRGAVEWIPVCPEVEVGMGVPREPIQIVRDVAGIRLVGVTSGVEWTERMRSWARQRMAELDQLDLSGFVLKARSPSCGPRDVPMYSGGRSVETGRGLFAGMLAELHPELPLEDEERLHDSVVRSDFLWRVSCYHRRAT
jgi:uncharacterized protein YbbK (DUF523 family)